ncbi:tetratricopeptide repeat protein [Fulvivirgaceae bacterium BMA12]|uniref:Tetratricopeptide repeat protein n=1 Tax=Agaribacillus aureus TaxID=3051825 RepID=A0ABT8LGA0_9BACT|nr:tetratricopeptide repeat protein [Fulvivirgaceae bacterium BMA12]
MKRFFIIILIFGFVSNKNTVQANNEIDSLIATFNTTLQPAQKIPVLLRLTELHFNSDFEKAFEYANELQMLTSQYGTIQDKATAAWYFGKVYRYNGQFDLAVVNYLFSAELFGEADLGLDLAGVLNDIGYIFYKVQEYEQAKQYYYDALFLYEKHNASESIIRINFNLSTCFREEKKYNDALRYTDQALKLAERIMDQVSINKTYNYIGTIYFEKGEYQLARENYLNSIKNINEKENKALRLSYGYNNIGETYQEEGDLTRAHNYYKKALAEMQKLSKPALLVNTLLNIGKLHLAENDCLQAISALSNAISKVNPKIIDERLIETVEKLNEAYKIANERNLEVDLKPLIAYNEILGNQFKLTNEMRKSLVEQHNQYMLQNSFEKRALQANIGQLQNTKLYLIWGAIFVVVVFLVLIFLMNQALKKAQRKSQEMVMALTQMKGVLGKSFQRMAEDDAFTITTKK